MGHAIMSGNLAQGFMLLTDTAYHVGPCFNWNSMLRLTWTCMLMCGGQRDDIAKYVLECKQSLGELAVWDKKMDQHW